VCELTTLKLILDTSFKGQPNTPSQLPYVFACLCRVLKCFIVSLWPDDCLLQMNMRRPRVCSYFCF